MSDFSFTHQQLEALEKLTQKRRDALDLKAQGLLRKEIADRLGITESGVDSRINNACANLKVKNAPQAVDLYRRYKIYCQETPENSQNSIIYDKSHIPSPEIHILENDMNGSMVVSANARPFLALFLATIISLFSTDRETNWSLGIALLRIFVHMVCWFLAVTTALALFEFAVRFVERYSVLTG